MCCCNESEYECYSGGMRARKDVRLLVTKMGQKEIKPEHLKWFLGLTKEELNRLSSKDHVGRDSWGGTVEIF
jgi:aspartyl/asparaginyl-tRNA synthetase